MSSIKRLTFELSHCKNYCYGHLYNKHINQYEMLIIDKHIHDKIYRSNKGLTIHAENTKGTSKMYTFLIRKRMPITDNKTRPYIAKSLLKYILGINNNKLYRHNNYHNRIYDFRLSAIEITNI